MHQYAYTGQGKTIHSSGQLEWFQNKVDDCSHKLGGLQSLCTPDGYVHLFSFCHGLPYIKICPYTDAEWETLPKVTWTSDADWDPDVLDGDPPDEETWYNAVFDLPDGLLLCPFDKFGCYHHHMVHEHSFADGEMDPALASIQKATEDASTFHTPHFHFHAAGGQQL